MDTSTPIYMVDYQGWLTLTEWYANTLPDTSGVYADDYLISKEHFEPFLCWLKDGGWALKEEYEDGKKTVTLGGSEEKIRTLPRYTKNGKRIKTKPSSKNYLKYFGFQAITK